MTKNGKMAIFDPFLASFPFFFIHFNPIFAVGPRSIFRRFLLISGPRPEMRSVPGNQDCNVSTRLPEKSKPVTLVTARTAPPPTRKTQTVKERIGGNFGSEDNIYPPSSPLPSIFNEKLTPLPPPRTLPPFSPPRTENKKKCPKRPPRREQSTRARVRESLRKTREP